MSEVNNARQGAVISILIVDDHEVVREGVRTLINHQSGLEVVGEAADADSALEAIARLEPALVLTDIGMKQVSGIALAAQIRERAHCWAIGVADHEEIDALNILGATLLAMRRALLGLSLAPDAVVVDGNRLPRLDDLACGANARAIVRGDASHPSISGASILAKTWRDQFMEQLDTRFPGYGFAIHKGYPTPRHLAALRQLGVSPVHRRSFGPVRSALSDS